MATAAEWLFILGLVVPPAVVVMAALFAVASALRGQPIDTGRAHVQMT